MAVRMSSHGGAPLGGKALKIEIPLTQPLITAALEKRDEADECLGNACANDDNFKCAIAAHAKVEEHI